MAGIVPVRITTKSKNLFEEFLDGATLPHSSCERVMCDLSEDHWRDYTVVMNRVRSRLKSTDIQIVDGVAFVEFQYRSKEVDLPTLVRLLNMTQCKGRNFIVVNHSELVYIPADSKKYHSVNEMVQWITEVQKVHLKKLKKKETLDRIKGLFDFNKLLA